jgi:hypothetical protein
MPHAERPRGTVEIILPDGVIGRSDRRRGAILRLYSALDGLVPGMPTATMDRRRRRRPGDDQIRARRLDLET